eukprot:2695555-Alexandrium_andersonii.AAC.1
MLSPVQQTRMDDSPQVSVPNQGPGFGDLEVLPEELPSLGGHGPVVQSNMGRPIGRQSNAQPVCLRPGGGRADTVHRAP